MIITGINGSMGADTKTRRVLEIALAGARETGAETTLIDLRELSLPFCDGRSDVSTYSPVVQRFRNDIRRSHGVIVCTPEYHNSFSGVIKNAFDLLGKREMEGKMCGLIGVAGGEMEANAVNGLRVVCRALGAWVVPHHVALANAERLFDKNGLFSHPRLQERLERLGRDVAKYARLLTLEDRNDITLMND